MTKKLLFLPILLVLAVSTIGVTMAFWSDILTINGKLTTGTLDGVWSKPTFIPPWENEWKDIATIKVEVFPADPDKAYITVKGAYPGYQAYIGLGIHYQGSVPAHIKSIDIDAPPELKVWIDPLDGSNPIGYQLHYLDEYFFRVWVEVIEIDGPDGPIVDPMQNTEYTFTVTIVLCQYNDPSQI